MTLPITFLSLSAMKAEFGGGNSLSGYYRGGSFVPINTANGGYGLIATTAPISFGPFRGGAKLLAISPNFNGTSASAIRPDVSTSFVTTQVSITFNSTGLITFAGNGGTNGIVSTSPSGVNGTWWYQNSSTPGIGSGFVVVATLVSGSSPTSGSQIGGIYNLGGDQVFTWATGSAGNSAIDAVVRFDIYAAASANSNTKTGNILGTGQITFHAQNKTLPAPSLTITYRDFNGTAILVNPATISGGMNANNLPAGTALNMLNDTNSTGVNRYLQASSTGGTGSVTYNWVINHIERTQADYSFSLQGNTPFLNTASQTATNITTVRPLTTSQGKSNNITAAATVICTAVDSANQTSSRSVDVYCVLEDESTGGSGGGGCVEISSYLYDGQLAGTVIPGQSMILGDEMDLGMGLGTVSYSAEKTMPGYRITTSAGVSLVCSGEAQIPTPEGLILAPNLLGKSVAVRFLSSESARWDEVISVEEIGTIQVQHITVGDKSFWAGEKQGEFILHHNLKLVT